MSDMTLPQAPQISQAPQIPQAKAVKVSPKPVENAQESASDRDFSKVLKSQVDGQVDGQVDAGSKPAESVDSVPESAAKESVSLEDATETAVAAGKPLPQTGNASDALLAALTGSPATTEASAETAPTASAASTAPVTPAIPDAPVVSAEVEALPEDSELPTANVMTGLPTATVIDAVPTRTERGAATARPQLAPWSTGATGNIGRKTELPPTAQDAVAQMARELPVDSEATRTAPFALERFGAEVRALAGAQPGAQLRATGVDTLAERLLGASPQTAQPAHATAPGMTNPLPQDATTGARPALPTASLDTPLRQPGWDQALGERVLWVVNNKFQGVELKLNPAHLGPIEVRVQMQNDQAQVSFVAQHAPAREALEAALPRLREMFGANGFNLVDVNVSQHSFAEQQRHAQTAEGNFRANAGHDAETDLAGIAQPEFSRASGLPRAGIDLFA